MPPRIYKTRDGKRVPSVSTIRKYADPDSEGLLRWAHRLGMDGLDMDAERDAAAAVGTISHACIEAEFLGMKQPDLSHVGAEERAKVATVMESWRAWRKSVVLDEVLGSEIPLVSENLLYGGTMDAVVSIGDKRVLADWKTGAGLYVADLVQVAAYGMLWDEHHPEQPIEEYTLLRLGKDAVGFTMKTYPAASMQPAREAFTRCREIHNRNNELKRMIR